MDSVLAIAWVGVGSALGGMMRYAMTLGFERWMPSSFPLATLTANVVGSFVTRLPRNVGSGWRTASSPQQASSAMPHGGSHGRLYHFFFLQPADSGAHAERPADLCYSEHGSLTPPLLAGRGVGFQGSQSVVPAGVITPWNTTQGTPEELL